MAHLLLIDDEAPIRASLREILEYEGHKVAEAGTGMDGILAATKTSFDAIFCDVKMPQMDGLDVLDMLAKKQVASPVIMISGHGTVETAVDALKKGAYDFIQKPLDLNRVLVTLRNVLEREVLVETTKVLAKKVHTSQSHQMVGESEGIQQIQHMVDTVAPTDARVLITGANGSGKELVARQVHNHSQRADGPFVEVNCAAIPSELIESELFGHEKGAFTSAVSQRKGKFEQAQGGTLFLDEVGDMSASAQAKVLRALQENKISRVGSDKDIQVDVRVVAATNKDLKAAIAAGEFREDLYHRLAVVPIHVPSLAERASDIPLLVAHFLDVLCAQSGRPVPKVTAGAMTALSKAPWTGNVRELRNAVERLLIFCPAGKSVDEALVQKFGHLG
ncbi:MAG: sigma-54-dependent transcriptional regulator [Flavobacteriales bacterium]